MIILLSFLMHVTATKDITQLGNDENRQKWIDDLKNEGYTTDEIARELISQIASSQNINMSSNSINDQKIALIQEMLNGIDVIEVDDNLQSAVPYYWVLLISDDDQKQIFISEIEKSGLSDQDQTELKANLLDIWKKYPMKFEKIGHTTYISPDTKNKEVALTKSEILTLQQMDIIHSFKDNLTIINPKWAVNPCHYDLVYYAALNSGYPDPITAAEHSGDPDNYLPWNSPSMWFNPDWNTGGAPNNAQIWFFQARIYYQSGNINDASVWIGSASHFLTDVSNPLHTGHEAGQFLDKILHPNGDDIHSLYESYVSTHWDDFDDYVMGNQYSYKWDWNGADASTVAVATSSHRFVDTLYTKIYYNRAGFWNEDYWTREITRVCFMTASQYANGLINAIRLKAFPGYTILPTDPDYDRDIEDLDGNSIINYDDVLLYFTNMEWIRLNQPIVPFDYNNNGYIDFNDVVILYSEI